jgi:hypothetical protein
MKSVFHLRTSSTQSSREMFWWIDSSIATVRQLKPAASPASRSLTRCVCPVCGVGRSFVGAAHLQVPSNGA